MSIDNLTARKLANLARIEISEDQLKDVVENLRTIIRLFDQLDEVDTLSVKPMTDITGHFLSQRDDLVIDTDCQDKIISNAPKVDHGFFVVPRIID
ncbi:aspartyl/glutamyl-tRNA(Asn/Gln) amidotransferase subunit C [Candidatus Endolissoclinum faulkneri L5]|uniref:Aspartyl/glutamyl-tRNA(Asn/Gln) amidotransferase subunit C n=1 Tax=Candidatus Endolissoclinum faulkneri L5 TaxID=1401328 RepID=V9TUT7_9PROT|nr:Asp-tRNA(Asn)/Glu-tRNA(Gln) amidotransferase subunit GatC [Candidatus Endolissoclinum faulkneri]AHC73458.1 aspartyl/glutamyl-tRNA(Asn/Gln) amidotransferase subunit C [Candidatus Endolissoclinum faulkneri L5]